MRIQPTDLVLEIGSGNRPRKRSDVLCDKFFADNTERSGGDAVVIDKRPFIVADGLALPFKDGSFDYVVASHILEHIEDPHKFVRELTRVARAGYIETPSELGEKIFGWAFHRWIVRIHNGTLIMRPRTGESPFGNFFHEMYEQEPIFAEFVDSHVSHFYVQLEWEGEIKLEVQPASEDAVRFNAGAPILQTRAPWKSLAIRIVSSILRFLLRVLRYLRKFE